MSTSRKTTATTAKKTAAKKAPAKKAAAAPGNSLVKVTEKPTHPMPEYCEAVTRQQFEAADWGSSHVGCQRKARVWDGTSPHPGWFCVQHSNPSKRYGVNPSRQAAPKQGRDPKLEHEADQILKDPQNILKEAPATQPENAEPTITLNTADAGIIPGEARVVLALIVSDVWTPEAAAEAFIDHVARHGLQGQLLRVTDDTINKHYLIRDGRQVDLERVRADAGL